MSYVAIYINVSQFPRRKDQLFAKCPYTGKSIRFLYSYKYSLYIPKRSEINMNFYKREFYIFLLERGLHQPKQDSIVHFIDT